ncbi:glycosyltransferase [Marivirga harenae]|uniref:glycosyltransferase n=1 Tax=Marivirga harenae TaxID=2010992 RepID=UPI0026E05E78|nr:glycosyltransferase [Marivirga harenae]WKV11322.1 glycosyltransferase [Marivirga harenae]|tara:strand:- start:66073 stop:67194 length:1122 start_codon:yes stop_codon:yes gene_type:complete
MEQIQVIFIIFIVVILIQAYFNIYYFFTFVYSKNDEEEFCDELKPTSVIICAHNELKNLKNHLPKFLNQTHDNYEVILVNDRSNDGSQEWLEDLETSHSHLKVLHISETPVEFNAKKYALTKGIELAKNEIILLSDADCEPNSRHWVDIMSRSFKESTSIVLGVSLYKKRLGILNQFIRFETLQTALLYLSFAQRGSPYMGVGRNMAYRKSFFEQKNGFQNFKSVMGGDDDLWVNQHSTKENTRICTHFTSLTLSNPKENWSAFFQQKKRHLSVGKHYKTDDKLRLGLFHLTQSIAWILFILGCMLGNPTDCLILSFLFLTHVAGQYVVFYKLSIKFGIKFVYYNLPIMELFFNCYYWTWGIYASLTKHLKWK